ncbi:MAG: hypothetical protein U1F98_10650 [Verrucomicrobiota bacterium]
MPIKINLMAEALALEEQRRRDPVKRVILAGAIVSMLILAWASSLLVQTMMARGKVTDLEADLNSRTNQYRQILDNQRKLGETRQKLLSLQRYATNRFLLGNLLNALQTSTVDNVQLVRLKIDQSYTLNEAKTNTPGGKGATVTEKTVLQLNAKDTSPTPGDSVNKFQDTLSAAPYFQEMLGKSAGFHLSNLGAPQADPNGPSFVLFMLEARFPEKSR